MENRFNLIEEDWIPVGNVGRVSLRRIFTDQTLKALGGNPIQKISILKLLLAITQSAYTPENDEEWQQLGTDRMAAKCIEYLEAKKEFFWLYGEKPFLQMPILREIRDNKNNKLPVSSIGRTYLPDLPSENDSILFQNQINRPLTDAEKAVFIVSLMNYSPGGKRTVKNVSPLTPEYQGKTNSAKPSPSLGNYIGYLNSCLWGNTILDTVFLNLFTYQQLNNFPSWAEKQIIPPWEDMPTGEDDNAAKRLKNSYMATLCSLSRFILLENDGIIYMEGIQYPSHKNGWREPFMSYDASGKVLWLNMERKPWRNLDALLSASFVGDNYSYYCPQIVLLLDRIKTSFTQFGIYSGGLKVRGSAGDQSVKQTDDYIESVIFLDSHDLNGFWYASLKNEMEKLEKLSNRLYGAVKGYYKSLNSKQDNLLTTKATEMFWQLCERRFQELVYVCNKPEEMKELRKVFAGFTYKAYDAYCPKDTARQISSWAKNRPNIGKYITDAEKKEEKVGEQ